MLADKLYNANSLLRDLTTEGANTWKKFKGGRDGTMWYYRTALEMLDDGSGGHLLEELKQVLEKDRTRKDAHLVEEVMEAISKDSACYGLDDCKEKVSLGAVKGLLVSDNFIMKVRQEDNFKKLDNIIL